MAEGQFLGARKAYVYTSDDGTTEYVLSLDETLATLTGVDLENYTGQDGVIPAPKRFKPRKVYWQSNDGKYRKKITCGTTDSTLYKANKSTTLTIDGVAGATTGRVGEKLTFVRAQANDPTP